MLFHLKLSLIFPFVLCSCEVLEDPSFWEGAASAINQTYGSTSSSSYASSSPSGYSSPSYNSTSDSMPNPYGYGSVTRSQYAASYTSPTSTYTPPPPMTLPYSPSVYRSDSYDSSENSGIQTASAVKIPLTTSSYPVYISDVTEVQQGIFIYSITNSANRQMTVRFWKEGESMEDWNAASITFAPGQTYSGGIFNLVSPKAYWKFVVAE